MNPIVYNKNGQFRFNDFIGYLPEFLRSEPDVVTYLQVMSDYINNAYRNVEVTDEFELVKVCTSTDCVRVENWMERLCGMFRTACDRGDKVAFLSVPRNNVKSNVVLGNANAEYARTIEVDLDDVQDSFSSASSRLGGVGSVADGDVVYVKYRRMSPVRTVAYDYVKETDLLVKDPMGSSQDPFTGSDNDPNTMIEFTVEDVGHVVRRYGEKADSVVYYEVYFPIKISGVSRVPSTGYVETDIDGDGAADSIYVDYYNLGSASGDSLNAYIRFADSAAFGWTGEFPGGMFYFRDTSAASLTNLDSKDTMSVSDTMLSPGVDKYRISRIEKQSGEYRIYMDVFPGIYSNALFYVMRGTEGLGVYKMNGDIEPSTRFDDGEPYISVVNMSGMDYDIEHKTGLVLVSIPLAYSKYTLDYDARLPLVKWSGEISGLGGETIGTSANMRLIGATAIKNTLVYGGTAVRTSKYTVVLSTDITGTVAVGQKLRSDAFVGGFATVTGIRQRPGGQTEMTVGGDGINPISGTIDVYDCSVGYIAAVDTSVYPEYEYTGSYAYFTLISDNADAVRRYQHAVANFVIGGSTSARLCDVGPVTITDDGNYIIAIEKPAGIALSVTGISQLTLLSEDNNVRISEMLYVKRRADGNVVGVPKPRKYKGSLFTQEYMLATSGNVTSLLVMVTDVVPVGKNCRAENGKYICSYRKGEYVYDESTDTVYLVGQSVEIEGTGFTASPTMSIDYMKHYSVGYKKVLNDCMPYSGPVSTLDYDQKPNYDGDMSVNRIPLYAKKVNDVRLKYGWQQRQYVYYKDTIGIDAMDRAGFIEVYSGNDDNPVDVDLRDGANVLVEPAMLYGCGSRYYVVDVDKNPTAVRNNDGSWTVTVRSAGHGLPDGASISVTVDDVTGDNKVFVADSVPAKVVSADVIQYVTVWPDIMGNTVTGNVENIHITHDRAYKNSENYPTAGDIAMLGDKVYIVGTGDWELVSPDAIVSPATIYARQNLFDVSVTNPTFAMGDEYVIKQLSLEDMPTGVAQVQLSQRIPELDIDPSAYEGTGRVYIRYVNQGVFNGWHTIKTVHNGGIIDIVIDPSIEVSGPIMPIMNRKMTLSVGRWYKYTLNGYDWSKTSGGSSYVTSNRATSAELSDTSLSITMKYAHGLSVGDHILVDISPDGNEVYRISSGNRNSSGYIKATTVTGVVDDHTIEIPRGIADNSLPSVYRGYIVDGGNLVRLVGEYPYVLDGEKIRFRNGDVVITLSQTCLDEIRGWRVTENTVWVPLAKKRTFKVERMSVDLERNPAYELEDLENEVEYRYVTYSDADVVADTGALRIGYSNARNYHFEHPYVENLDTTQNAELEYSSKYDYATVAPRDDMDTSFKGVPDMGYPLAERIERLAYLRDPDVIDMDLIGYLARFMGYDITALADDIRSSNVYKDGDDREKAIRETVAHLPQFYALNGTKPGINMLMATFGLVGELITMWTRADDPYGRLVRQTDVDAMIAKDGTSSWVPTPHVTLDIKSNDTYNCVLMGNEELVRMREQIRRCKPINVVFDGIRVIFDSSTKASASISNAGMSIKCGTVPLIGGTEYDGIDTDPCLDEDCSF